MKNITKQYQDLLEGKMSKDNFMRNVRTQFPEWISPVNSFQDAVNILKSKRILSEMTHLGKWAVDALSPEEREAIERVVSSTNLRSSAITHKLAQIAAKKSKNVDDLGKIVKSLADEYGITDSEQITHIIDLAASEYKVPATDYSQRRMGEADSYGSSAGGVDVAGARHIAKMWNSLDKEVRGEAIKMAGIVDTQGLAAMDFDAMMTALQPGEGSLNKLYNAIKQAAAAEEESMISQMQSKSIRHGEYQDPEIGGDLYDKMRGVKETLKEATEKSEGSYKKVTGKDQYELFAEIDKVNPYEFKKGLQIEMGMQYLPTPNYFTNAFNPETLAKAARKVLKNLKREPAYYTNSISAVSEKKSGLKQDPKEVNVKADGATKIKGYNNPTANTQTSLSKSERAKGKPEGVKEMKPSKKGMGGLETMKSNGKLPKGVELMKESTMGGEYMFNGTLKNFEMDTLRDKIGAFEYDVEMEPGQTIKTTITSATKTPEEIRAAVDSVMGLDKMQKLKEVIRERVKKALKEKLLKSKTGEFVIATKPGNINKLKGAGYTEEPGTEDVVSSDNPTK